MPDFSEVVQTKSNDELLRMVYEFDQWSPEMLTAVENELLNRKILPGDISSRRQQLLDKEDAQLSKGKKASPFGQIIGWLTVFGFLGIAIGYNYAFSKIKSKYSNKVYYKYYENSRIRGRYLFIISIFLTAMVILYRLIKQS